MVILLNQEKPTHCSRIILSCHLWKSGHKATLSSRSLFQVSFARPSSPSIKDANLYISGIPKEASAGELEELFSEVGTIITSRILTDPTTGTNRKKDLFNNFPFCKWGRSLLVTEIHISLIVE